ncbi:MAG TPA: transketolase [Lacipirellulaceae bacterium]|nr:transketolase [Lacipirellulaceae bacterium]
MATVAQDIGQLSINTIRTLAMDAVEKANSGHPGTPMALAPVAYQLWAEHLRYDPANPVWPNRDRFVLSCGHASMLLYSLIHLAGVKDLSEDGQKVLDRLSLTLKDLEEFRQWGSKTPGHPEIKHTAGVETTTGPLGQGCGNSVGMAIARNWLAARYNKPGFELFNFNVWTQCSDGDLMEGVANEAASIAGHLKLGNLCWIYDNNSITIEGRTPLAFDEDVATRFRGLGWHVLAVQDANDLSALDKAYKGFLSHEGSPTLIIVKSIIGYGAPTKQDTNKAHGEPLGDEEIKKTKEFYGWPDKKFYVPPEVPKHFQETLGKRGAKLSAEWTKLFGEYEKKYPELASELKMIQKSELPKGWDNDLPTYPADAKGMATRVSGGKAENAIAKSVPWMLGGSADLAPSTKTLMTFAEAGGDLEANNPGGRNMHFGIREHGMVAAVNGMVSCGLRAFGATFFVFSDYCRPSIRLAAIMKFPTIIVFTHDSIGVGEDGPTHEPIEQLAACRAIPRLIVMRPADANEASQAWKVAMEQTERPTAMILTRQDLPTVDRAKYGAATGVAKGGYVLGDSGKGEPDVIIMSTGSEVQYAVAAHEKLVAEGVKSRVVSLPSFELFNEQPVKYRDEVLPPKVTKRIAIEAGVKQCWDQYLGFEGVFVGLDTYGASAPYQEIYKHRGITAEAVVAAAKKMVK